MRSTVIRWLLAGVATAVLAPSVAVAGPIVISNSSYVVGTLSALQDGTPPQPLDYLDSRQWEPLPTFGTWARTGSQALTPSGDTFFACAVYGDLSPEKFWGLGYTFSLATASGEPGAGAMAWSRAVYEVTFSVPEPTMFSYSARYSVLSPDNYSIVARLERADSNTPLFLDQFVGTGLLNESGVYGGTLVPGLYTLLVMSDPTPATAPPTSLKQADFEFTMQFQDASQVPEPATLVLVATGLGWVASRRRRA